MAALSPLDMLEQDIQQIHDSIDNAHSSFKLFGVNGQGPPPLGAGYQKRAKLTVPRWSITREALARLEAVFSEVRTPSLALRQQLAQEMGVTPRQVQVWFRNRRQRVRLASVGTGPYERPMEQWGDTTGYALAPNGLVVQKEGMQVEKMAVEGAFMQGLNPAAAGLPYPPGAQPPTLSPEYGIFGPAAGGVAAPNPAAYGLTSMRNFQAVAGGGAHITFGSTGAPHLTVAPGTQGPQTAAPVPVAAVKSSTSSSLEAPASPLRSEPTEEPTRITPDGSVHSTVHTEKGENEEGVTAADIEGAVTEAEAATCRAATNLSDMQPTRSLSIARTESQGSIATTLNNSVHDSSTYVAKEGSVKNPGAYPHLLRQLTSQLTGVPTATAPGQPKPQQGYSYSNFASQINALGGAAGMTPGLAQSLAQGMAPSSINQGQVAPPLSAPPIHNAPYPPPLDPAKAKEQQAAAAAAAAGGAAKPGSTCELMKLPQWLEMTHRELARQQALEAQMLAQHHKEQAAALIATATQVGGGMHISTMPAPPARAAQPQGLAGLPNQPAAWGHAEEARAIAARLQRQAAPAGGLGAMLPPTSVAPPVFANARPLVPNTGPLATGLATTSTESLPSGKIVDNGPRELSNISIKSDGLSADVQAFFNDNPNGASNADFDYDFFDDIFFDGASNTAAASNAASTTAPAI